MHDKNFEKLTIQSSLMVQFNQFPTMLLLTNMFGPRKEQYHT